VKKILISTMAIDSAWIFRICLTITAILILFADTLGYGGASARSDNSIDNAKFINPQSKNQKGSSGEIATDRNVMQY
jgi:hypothetical protein